MSDPRPSRAQFGLFHLDLTTGELRGLEEAVYLPNKPFQLLQILLENAGQLVTREEIQKKLWPNNTVVDFEHGINTAMRNLRRALGDSAADPKYIETVGRRGYRLKVPVDWESDEVEQYSIIDGGNTNDQSAVHVRPVGGIGSTISHYRLLEIVGGGGMGVVYKAEDLRLGRLVALKFLPEELGDDPRALERFEREARAASALEHRNICPIYEFGEHQGQPFLAMQLLKGHTLRDLLAGWSDSNDRTLGPLTNDHILDLSIQILDGLDAAHRKGIIHRDVKPANIFVTDAGEAKILDFGVAKLIARDRENAPLVSQPFEQDQPVFVPTGGDLTGTGAAIGTAAYMSPEQVRGEELDSRTDLFSFGLVLYEMCTGRRALGGATAAAIHDMVLHQEILPAHQLNRRLPAKLEVVFAGALKKDRELRYQHASDIRRDLKRLQEAGSWRRLLPSGVIVVALIAMTTSAWLSRHRPSSLPELKLRQLTHNLDDRPVRSASISPDGSYLAYSDTKGIHIERLDDGRTQTIRPPDVLKGRQDGWSIGQWFPDGKSFLASVTPPSGSPHYTEQRSSIWKFSIANEIPRKLRDDAEASSLSVDGAFIYFVTGEGRYGYREIWQMDADGERAQKLFETDENSEFIDPRTLADGKRLYYLRIDSSRKGFFESRDFRGGPAVTAMKIDDDNFVAGHWFSDGRFFFVLSESDLNDYSCNLWQTRIDLKTGKMSKSPQRLTDWTGFCMELFNGTADGKELAFQRWAGQGTISIADIQADGEQIGEIQRLTPGAGRHRLSSWTADSKAVVFLSKRNGQWGIFKQSLTQDTPEPIVTPLPEYIHGLEQREWAVPRLSPDGRWLLYTITDKSASASATSQLMRVTGSGGQAQRVLTGNLYGPADCARLPSTICAIAEPSLDSKQFIFTAFSPDHGRGAEVARLDIDPGAEYRWAISSDGTRIAVVSRSEGRIHILSTEGKPTRDVMVKGWSSLTSVAWAANNRALLVGSLEQDGSVLLHVDLRGKSQVLWRQAGGLQTWAIPSPDGRHLAIEGWTLDSNIWMMENF